MAGFTRAELKRIKGIADNAPITMIAVLDEPPAYPIGFSNNLDLLGYLDRDAVGMPMARLLPPDKREGHPALMERFKAKRLREGGISEPQQMGPGNTLPAWTKLGQPKSVHIDIDYLGNETQGFYLAFLQPEGEVYFDVTKIYDIRNKIDGVFAEVKANLRRKIAAAGGVGMVALTGAVSYATPMFSAIKNAWVSWQATMQSDVAVTGKTEVTVTAALTPEQRQQRLFEVRDYIRRVDPDLMAVAYYRFDQTINGVIPTWLADTPDINGKEVWFFDASERRLVFTLAESQALLRHDCVFKLNGAAMVYEPGQPRRNIVVCPTYYHKRERGLVVTEVKGLIVGAYPLTVTELEPHAGHLWPLGISLETVMGE